MNKWRNIKVLLHDYVEEATFKVSFATVHIYSFK